MAQINSTAQITIDINRPVTEINAVISYLLQTHPKRQVEILKSIQKSIDDVLAEIEAKKETKEGSA